MSKRNTYHLIICLSVFSLATPQYGRAQDLSADLDAMYKTYAGMQSFKSDVKVEVFSAAEASSRIMTRKASIRKEDENFYYRIDNTEMLLTENGLIMANNGSRQLIFRKLGGKELEATRKAYLTSQLDSALLKHDSVVYHGTASGLKHYTVYTAKNMISRTELYLHASDNTLSSLTYFYNPQLMKNAFKTEITFSSQSVSDFPDTIFSEENYLIKTGKLYKPAGKYASYKLNIIDDED
jgi:hypothetical protein